MGRILLSFVSPHIMTNTTKTWHTYILRCADNTLYTGITTDIYRRESEHNGNKLGAKYTRARQPVKVVYQEAHKTRSEAAKREFAIKKLTKDNKELLILHSDAKQCGKN
jgi:putative endonuclease